MAVHLAKRGFRWRHQHQPQSNDRRPPAGGHLAIGRRRPSVYETRPSYQSGISAIVGTQRGTPDVAADANPSSGVWVYASPYWYIVGGTSVATPVWAGIGNAAARFAGSSPAELMTLYQDQGTTPITMGTCGSNQGYLAAGAWNLCTGLGSPLSQGGK